MLLNDEQVALAEVDERCRATAARYADAAGMIDDTDLAVRFRALCEARERFAARLEEEMRALDVLPRSPGSEIEELRSFATHLKAAVSAEEAQVLVEGAEAAERELETAVSAALNHEFSPPVRLLLEELRDTVDCVRADLAAWKSDR